MGRSPPSPTARPTAGMATVREIMRAHPQFATAFGIFASMQRDTGDLAGAVATLEDLVRRGIADQSTMVVLAGYLQEAGALDRSARPARGRDRGAPGLCRGPQLARRRSTRGSAATPTRGRHSGR